MSIDIELQLQRGQLSININCTIKSQGITAIYGHSGAGKTTLLRWIAGLEQHAQGSLHFDNEVWQSTDVFVKAEHRHIAYVFQDARLFPHLDVLGNLNYAYHRRRKSTHAGPSLEQVCDWLTLTPLLTQDTTTLSGGERQRVAMGRALLSNPKLILMDEPLASLDKASRESILQTLEQLHQHLDVAMVYVSHSIEEVSRLANELLIIEKGQLIAQGNLLTLCHRLDLRLAHEDNAASIIEGTIQAHDSHYGLSELSINDQHRLYLTNCDADVGSNLRLRIPARDVSLSLQHHQDNSILNILPCTIDAIEKSNAAQTLVKLRLDDHFLLARLTHKSLDRLQLHIGQQVYAQIKSVALLNDRKIND